MQSVLLKLVGVSAVILVTACEGRPTDSASAQSPPGAPQKVSQGVQATLASASANQAGLAFHDVEAQTREFIGHYKAIKLTPEQEKAKAAVLGAIPAPCCSSFSALTCCCPCNFSKALWGMTHYLIARQGYDEARLKDAVHQWLAFSRPNGSSGKACFSGGCNRSFAHDGCGGMSENQLVF